MANGNSVLEQQFEEACLSDVEECRQLGYNPSYFLKMLSEYGAVETARRLILQDGMPDGFSRLWELHRLPKPAASRRTRKNDHADRRMEDKGGV
jgi:hypothetical protein